MKVSLSLAKQMVRDGNWWDFCSPEKFNDRLSSKKWRMNHLYKILDKDSKISVFKMNSSQERIFNNYKMQIKAGFGVRARELKARQMGITTFHCIYYLDDAIWNEGITAAIIAHKQEPLEKIFEIVKRAFDTICLPPDLKPVAKTENVRELAFEATDSRIYVSLAVRSGTVHRLHVSERAYVKDVKELKAGSYQAVPASGYITEETTANGMNEFYAAWSAKSASWEHLFMSWLEHKEYRTQRKPAKVYPEYFKYLNKHNATPEQRNWWFRKFDEFDRDFDLMRQEYPSTEEEAFVINTNTVFKNYQWIEAKPSRKIEVDSLKDGWLVENRKSPLTIWKEVEIGSGYSIGVDVAEGLRDGDFSCVYVINNRYLRVDACWHGHIDPDRLAPIVAAIGYYYNEAVVGVEINNHGLTTITSLRAIYNRHYKRTTFDKMVNTQVDKIGWHTNTKTKVLLIDDLARVIRDELIEVHDEDLKKEMNTYVREETDAGNVIMNALSGCYDDRIIGVAIAYQVYKKYPHSPADTDAQKTLDFYAKSSRKFNGVSRDRDNLG